jgi:hypothetical protein
MSSVVARNTTRLQLMVSGRKRMQFAANYVDTAMSNEKTKVDIVSRMTAENIEVI